MNDIYIFAACRDVKSDSATNATWFQTFPPYGRYPVGGTIKGAPADAEFVIDEASAKAVMDSFNALAKDANWPGILVDEEHYSLDREKSSAALKDAASAATKAKEDALAECRKMKCDAFIEANKAKIADVAACREVYMASPEAAEKLIAACKAPEAKPQTILAAACREQMLALPPGERAAFYKAHAAEIDEGK